MNENDAEAEAAENVAPTGFPPSFPEPEKFQCMQCGANLKKPPVCGIKAPCNNCGYPYPGGDCSDA